MTKFMIGDRVELIKPYDSLREDTVGLGGTVRQIGGYVGVEFDEDFETGHCLERQLPCDASNGYYVPDDCLKLISRESVKVIVKTIKTKFSNKIKK